MGLGGSIARTVRNGYRFDPTHCEGREYGASRLHDGGFGERIAGDLVESRLAACVNVMAPIRSVYSWKGELCRSEEIPFIAKTDDDRFEALAARVRALHSYETPCIVALPVARGDADFLAWITESTHPEE